MREEEVAFLRAVERPGAPGVQVELQEGWVEEGLRGAVPRKVALHAHVSAHQKEASLSSHKRMMHYCYSNIGFRNGCFLCVTYPTTPN